MNSIDYLELEELVSEDNHKKTNANLDNNQEYYNFNLKNIFSDFKEYGKQRIICIGNVQSGKTANIINVIREASNRGVHLVIFFGGNTEVLRSQSETRLDILNNEGRIKVLGKHVSTDLNYYLSGSYTYVITVMKNKDSFDKIFESLNNENLKDKKIILIDDECDYGSVNTSTLGVSSYHKKIYDIYERLYNVTLMSFTATPFANIINSKDLFNSIDTPKIVVLKNSNDYCGLSEFNKNYDTCYMYRYSNKNSHDINKNYENSINDSFMIYLYESARKWHDNGYKSIEDFQTQMLINIDSENKLHLRAYKMLINFLKDKFTRMENRKLVLLKEFRSVFINNKKPHMFDEDMYQEFYFEKIIALVKYIINNYKESIIILNSSDEHEKELFYNTNIKHKIIIGGVLLSRGVTFENLIVELILNYPNKYITIDTLLQRARWFGYRKNNMKYMKIIMTEELIQVFYYIERYLEIFTPGIMDFKKLKLSIKQLDLLYSSKNIRSTSYEKSK